MAKTATKKGASKTAAKARPKVEEEEVDLGEDAEDENEGEDAGVDFDDDDFEVDLEGVDETAASYVAMPPGIYPVMVETVTFGRSQRSNNPMWTWELNVTDEENEGRKLYWHTTFDEKSMPRTKKALMIIAPELLEGPFKPKEIAEEGTLEGKEFRVKVTVRPYQGEKRNNVRDVLPPEDASDEFAAA